MATDDKVRNTTQIAGGKVKEAAGRVLDDPDLEAEGRGDQAAGNLKQAGEKLKDAARDALRSR